MYFKIPVIDTKSNLIVAIVFMEFDSLKDAEAFCGSAVDCRGVYGKPRVISKCEFNCHLH